ncbi:hydantoinase/oxoprolinase family protein [soil metagenome]
MLLGVDVGGTFTDAVLVDGEEIHTAKAPTTPTDQTAGVLNAIEAVLAEAGAEPSALESFVHGMTVGTNALLEESGAATALVTTAGFEDLLDIARQDRPHLYRLCEPKPAPLVADRLRFGVAERTGHDGIVEELSVAEAERIARELAASDAESVAICLLFAFRDPSHELRLAAAIARAAPELHVSASHQVLAQFREYERCSTTVIDAYLSPLLGRYLRRLEEQAQEAGLPLPQVMRSSGGTVPAEEAARSGAWSVLSGPAGGAVGAGLLATLSGDGSALGFDMGGTSCDVCVVEEGRVRRTDSRELGGRVIQLPMVDVHTVGAGGGSLAWVDGGGALRVGPRSAGSQPGPACYGRGGSEPTVTDANLLLGVLDPGSALAGDVELDLEAARMVIGKLGGELGLGETETAEGIVRVANQEMVRALRVVTVERGVDPRDFALLPFGGAGPMHAAAIAEELGVRKIICPRASGVLSALGLIASEGRRDAARTVMLSGAGLTSSRLGEEVASLRESIETGMEEATLECVYELRYRGQSFELPIAAGPAPEPAELAERFASEHERRYGYRDPDGELELATIRVALSVAGAKPRPAAAKSSRVERSRRRLRIGGEWHEAEVLSGEPDEGLRAAGPCLFELPESTLMLPPGWSARVDAFGSVLASADSPNPGDPSPGEEEG